ncbi:MAG: ABC transporter substrate-binding protein [Magnetococcus sp. DMHC-6]
MACIFFLPLQARSESADRSPLPIVISVPGPRNLSYLPIDLISILGSDREENVEVQLLHTGGGALALKNLTSHNSDFAVAGLPAMISLNIHALQAVAVAAVDDAPLFVLMVRANLASEVHTPADLRGRRIGVNSSSLTSKTTSQQLIELMLRTYGVDPSEVNFVPAGQSWESQSSTIRTGQVDAIMGDEPFASRLLASGDVFFLANLADPSLVSPFPGANFLHAVLIARPEMVSQSSEKIAKMVRILRKTLQWMADHSAQDIVKALDLKDVDERKYCLETLRKYPHIYSKDGHFSSRQLLETERFFKSSNPTDPLASSLKLATMINEHWSGLSE